MTPDRRLTRFRADRLPALFPPGPELPERSLSHNCREGPNRLGTDATSGQPGRRRSPFLEWLRRHGQTRRTIDRFWGLVLTSALNETPERIGLRYARKVFLDGFLRHRRGFDVELPAAPLGELYGAALQGWLEQHQAQLVLNRSVKALPCEQGQVQKAILRGPAASSASNVASTSGGAPEMSADWYISAVPFDRLLGMLAPETIAAHPYFSDLRKLESSPITSVHLWLDRPVMTLPHVVLVDCVGQWVFNRGKTGLGEWYLQVVVSSFPPISRPRP